MRCPIAASKTQPAMPAPLRPAGPDPPRPSTACPHQPNPSSPAQRPSELPPERPQVKVEASTGGGRGGGDGATRDSTWAPPAREATPVVMAPQASSKFANITGAQRPRVSSKFTNSRRRDSCRSHVRDAISDAPSARGRYRLAGHLSGQHGGHAALESRCSAPSTSPRNVSSGRGVQVRQKPGEMDHHIGRQRSTFPSDLDSIRALRFLRDPGGPAPTSTRLGQGAP